MTEITPLIIEICLHYHCSNAAFPRSNAPAVQDAHVFLNHKGMLDYLANENRYFVSDENREALRVYVAALCRVPLPELKWVIPEK